MKKFITITLAMAMLLSALLLTSCGGKDETKDSEKDTTEAETVKAEGALGTLEAIWGEYNEDQLFSVVGGNMENSVMGAPGNYPLEDTAAASDVIGLPEDKLTMVSEAANLTHMMNANSFSAVAIKLADGTTAEDAAKALGNNLKERQWMCGIPETHTILKISDDTIVSVYGALDLVEVFLGHAKATFADSSVLLEQNFDF